MRVKIMCLQKPMLTLAATFLLSLAACGQVGGPTVIGTLRIAGGPLASMPSQLIPYRLFYVNDVTPRQLWIGEISGNHLIPTVGPTGPVGSSGPMGIQGIQGVSGTPGSAATLSIGPVTALAYGATPTATNTGTTSAAILSLGLPASLPPTAGGVLSGTYPNPGFATTALTTLGGVPATRQIIAGAGLVGGGTLSGDITLSLGTITFPVTSATASGGTTGLTFTNTTTGAVTHTLAGTLSVANGGTGATTASAALTNLGAAPASQFRTASAAVPAALINVATTTTVTWSTPFADANYRVCVTPVTGTGVTANVAAAVVSKTASGCVIRNTAQVALLSGQVTDDVIAVHD